MDGLHTGNYRELLASHTCGACGRVGQFETFLRGAHTGIKCRCGLEHPLPGVQWLRKAENLEKRPKPPETIGETWVRCGDYCWGCGLTRDELLMLGIGRDQHHTKPFADHGHTGPLIPLCAVCHEHITAVQRHHRRLRERFANGDAA